MNRRDHELVAEQGWLRRLARRLARSSARADDLVQDTFVTALRNVPPDAQLRPWLRVVMRKLAWGQVRSERRRAQREQGFLLTAPEALGALADELLDQGSDRERLAAALAGLPEPYHSTIVQRFLNGRSCADIARSENIPAGTVRWRQARGLEMLRSELAGRRQSAFWALPLVGAGGNLAARVWQTLAGRGTEVLVWLWLACAALIYVLGGADEQHGGIALRGVEPTHGPIAALAAVTHRAGPLPRTPDAPARGEAIEPAAPAAPLVDEAPASAPVAPAAHALRMPAAPNRRVDAREDCLWDPVSGWRCPRAVATAVAPGRDAVCALVHQQILSGQAIALASPSARSVLAAALQANRALARRLGCAAPPAGLDALTPGTRAGCTTEERDGAPCTVCPGERPVCAPAKCQSRAREDGVVCTTCVDQRGETTTDCPGDPPAGCHSELASSGLVCSSCDGGPAECLPAECVVDSRCLRCVDPRGRVATDCSTDYERFLTSGSLTIGAQNLYLSSCVFTWGVPKATGTTCHYPGLQTCAVSGTGDWQCLDCQYPDGAGMHICGSASESLPDPFAGRPLDLPAPGTCKTELLGAITRATCTRDDLSATMSCHDRDLDSCDTSPFHADPGCLATCRRPDGTRVSICNSARGPQPPEARVTP